MPELHLSTAYRLVLLILAAACSLMVSLYVYRSTVPPVSTVKRSLLISLRSSGLFFLFLLLGEPILSLVSHSTERPILAVLVDNSQSMTLADGNGRRDKTLRSILHSDVWKQIDSKGTLAYFTFDAKTKYLSGMNDDSLTFNGEATDISAALKTVQHTYASSNLQAVALITDGNSTVGLNPLNEAEELGVPLFPVGVGDTIEQKDLLIRKVLTNEIAYAGTKVPVNIVVHSSGYGGERVQVSLRDGTTIVDEKSLTIDKGARDYLVPLNCVTDKEGMRKYTAEISGLPGELTVQNNRTMFFIKVLKSKLRVALIAGSPSEDVAFIRRSLVNDKNIDVAVFLEQKNGQFYEHSLDAESLKDVDCILLVGFPTEQSTSRSVQTVLEAGLAEKPLFIILGRTMDFGKLHMLDPLLPFSVENPANTELQVFSAVAETQRNNPILKPMTSANITEFWSKLPPVFRPQGNFHSKVESEILATIRLKTMTLPDPLIVTQNVNKKKSLAVLGYGLWRWNMMSDAGNGADLMLEHFTGNAIRWLTTQEDSRKVTVQPSKHTYTTQDAIEFTGQVYDNNYQPLDDAQVEVRVQNGSETSSLTLNPLGSGQYQGTFGSLREGDYSFTAKVTGHGIELGNDHGTFSIGGLHAEFLDTRMNKPLLLQIAAQTGGKYYGSDDIRSLADDIIRLPHFTPRNADTSATIEIWTSRWMLAFVIFFFALEWFLRKRNGML
jgi:hypothetical protein